MASLTDKEIKNIRKRKSYKEMANTLRFIIENPDKPLDVLKLAFPVYNYGAGRRPQWANPESLAQVIKDYKDGKRQAEGTTG